MSEKIKVDVGGRGFVGGDLKALLDYGLHSRDIKFQNNRSRRMTEKRKTFHSRTRTPTRTISTALELEL